VADLVEQYHYQPTPVEDGIKRFVAWYLDDYKAQVKHDAN
jgi:hypothetical protein